MAVDRPPLWTRHELGIVEADRDRRPVRALTPALPGPSFPRLIAARRARCAEMAIERARRRRVRKQLMEVEALVAHRDLQLFRAIAAGGGAYIARRERKLAAAVRALHRVRALAEEIGAA